MKNIFLYRLTIAFGLLLPLICAAQFNPNYQLKVSLNDSLDQLSIAQSLQIENQSGHAIDTLFLNDWAHAFSSFDTPLSKRFAEEFDRSFYLSNKKNLGYTDQLSITQDGNALRWYRLQNQPDIIAIPLTQPMTPREKKYLQLNYNIKIPNARFTGYGVNRSAKTYDLRHWIITLSPYTDGQWKKYSHLNLDDASLPLADYRLRLEIPKSYALSSNLWQKQDISSTTSNHSTYQLWGNQVKEVKLILDQQNQFQTLQLQEDFEVSTDLIEPDNSSENVTQSTQRIYDFLNEYLGTGQHTKVLVTEKDYNKSPFYGLSQLPEILSPFESAFLNEVKLLKALSGNYVSAYLPIDQRQHPWIAEGLHIYLTIKYIERYYPEKKFVGRLARFPIIKTYQFAKLDFNEGFMLFSEQMLRLNNYQKATLSKDQLTRYNARIASPYSAGLALRYLEDFIGSSVMHQAIKGLFGQENSNDLESHFSQYTDKDLGWFFQNLLENEGFFDFKLSKIKSSDQGISVQLADPYASSIPVKVNLFKADTVVFQQWVDPSKNTEWILPEVDADFIAINAENGLPEINKKNNWKKINGGLLSKPLQIRAVKDIENPKSVQVFYNPITGYNLYDGLTGGFRLNNKKMGAQRFSLDIKPQYSFLENTLVGSFSGTYRWYHPQAKNYLTLFNIVGNTFHYAPHKRYTVLAPNISFVFRTPELRSNKRKSINFYLYKVEKSGQLLQTESPEYTVFKSRYLYANKESINYITSDFGIEFSHFFSKIDYTIDVRKLFPSGRQFQGRLFVGKFLDNRTGDQTYFDFNLNRPTDYLFQYSFFGRSETDGFFGQQFVMAEGGFKSLIPQSNANDWLISSNLNMGLWRWIEAYLDVGLLKNRNESVRTYYGSGIRLNVLPDYLEVFFPMVSSLGWEATQQAYPQKIRFVLSIRTKQLANLFSRRWF